MPSFETDTARIYFEDTGKGEPVIAAHGLIENTTYWNRTGVGQAIAEEYRFIPMDMRAHGKTVSTGTPEGYDIETGIKDIQALADHLNLEKFHLISHSTGGFISARLAMSHSQRLASLTLTGASSATTFIKDAVGNQKFHEAFAKSFENNSWETILENIKKQPFPLFLGIAETPDNQALWDMTYEIIKIGNRDTIANFVRTFYQDPDPKVEGLRQIACPTLIIVGERDELFLKPSRLMADEIPDARLAIFEKAGHMLCIEQPERVADTILSFIRQHPV